MSQTKTIEDPAVLAALNAAKAGCAEACFSGPTDNDTQAARGILKAVACGAAAQSDHGRQLALLLKCVGEGKASFGVADEAALRRWARAYQVQESGLASKAVALSLANAMLEEFNGREDGLRTAALAPVMRQGLWKKLGVYPSGVDRTLVESMHLAAPGRSEEWTALLVQAVRAALANGWGGSRVATAVADILLNPAQAESLGLAPAGLSVETVKYILGGTFRASLRPLNDAIISGRIKGVAGLVICPDSRGDIKAYLDPLIRGLVKHDVLVLTVGCPDPKGLVKPEEALALAGPGLKEVCEAVGIPPLLRVGGCADNVRLLEITSEIVKEGGLGTDLSDLPVVGVAPEWMSEKTLAMGVHFVASGIDVILGPPHQDLGSAKVAGFLVEQTPALFGAGFHICPDASVALAKIMELLEKDRAKLGINRQVERKLMDMKDRRALDV